MKKKEYMAPAIAIKDAELETLMRISIAGVDGNSGLELAGQEDETPTNADARLYEHKSVWDE